MLNKGLIVSCSTYFSSCAFILAWISASESSGFFGSFCYRLLPSSTKDFKAAADAALLISVVFVRLSSLIVAPNNVANWNYFWTVASVSAKVQSLPD